MNATTPAPHPRLLADIGGTQARFGWVGALGDAIGRSAVYACSDFASLEAVVDRYLADADRPRPASCAIGIATPVTGDAVTMTNRDWSFSVAALRAHLGVERLVVINDFAALALAVPALGPAELRRVGGGSAHAGAPLALLGAGTGLGMSGLLGGGTVPVIGEGGHMSLSAHDETEDRVVSMLRRRFGHASAERALSGAGLVNLHRACCELGGAAAEAIGANDVTARALAGSDACCVRAVELFFSFLGGVAGDLALVLGARGGVYIGGGIVPRLGGWIDRSAFRARFETKGRFTSYLSAVPTWVITGAVEPALRGADRALDLGLDR